MNGTVVALDLGGTHVTAGRVALDSAAVSPRAEARFAPGASRAELLTAIAETASRVAPNGIAGVGVAAPGPFDYAGGISLLSHKLEPLRGVDLRRELARTLGASSVSFLNDADAFLLGEWWVGAAQGHRRAVGVTLGTGLGSAFLLDGRVVDTGSSVPPEGSLHLVSLHGRPAEETISRRALIERYGAPELDVRELAELARAGDARAGQVFAELGQNLGEVTAPWLRSFAATCLVVGGSIGRAFTLFEPALRETLAPLERLGRIASAARLDDAALLGAAWHAARAGR